MNISDYHAGHYEQQYEYKSFLPTLIHHEWIIADPQLQQLLGQADRALGELNAFAQLVPDIDFFIRTYVAKEATQSSKIEGTQTSIEDAFKDAEDLVPEKRDDWDEVQNYISAINSAISSLEKLPLSNRLLKETHAILLRGVRGETKQPGHFRTSQNWIGVSLKNAAFVPPHHDRVPELMSDMEKFLHDENINVPPLIKIAIAHYQFETIHPFLDGNGRLGRLMISLYLASERLLIKPALYLSDYFERKKSIPSVSVNYACNGSSTKANEMGMRVMQERAYEKRGEQYLLIKSPPASGKSRALMFIALDKLHNQGLKKPIIVVPEKSIGSSFNDEPLSKFGFWADWVVAPQWNLCNAPGDDNGGKVGSVKAFLESSDRILVCTHATFRFAVDRFGIETFDDCLIAVDEFHHVSANPDNKLGAFISANLWRAIRRILWL
jgi:hypothetical protein